MARTNQHYESLEEDCLFKDISDKANAFAAANPSVKVLRLGIGNTTQPLSATAIRYGTTAFERHAHIKGFSEEELNDSSIPPEVAQMRQTLHKAGAGFERYGGYGDEQGNSVLREVIARHYAKRGVSLDAKEVFISDGAKADIANVQTIFAPDGIAAIPDPVYPVYVDTNKSVGRKILYLPCLPQNGFMPELPQKSVDLIYLCSPNNPTGAVATRDQLKGFVNYARQNGSVIIFDAAYAPFITDPSLPQTIYEIEGAKECAIEINSFSKLAGFCGIRLGWTVIPHKDGKLNKLWNRRTTTFFNGASSPSQAAGLGVLTEQGQRECQQTIDYYRANTALIRTAMQGCGLQVHGGEHAPYVWVKTPSDMKSWDFFDKLLRETGVVCTPGSGFGSQGEGYVRFSGFNHKEITEEAVANILKNLRI